MPSQANVALAAIRVGGREYPLVSERTCKTCSSVHRENIERQVVSGRTWSAIARDLPDDAGLTSRNLADHFRNEHLPIAAEAVQQLAEANATSTGEVVREAATPVSNYLGFAKTVIGEVSDRVARGEVRPDVRDALRAAELLARWEPAHVVDEGDYVAAFVVYHELAHELMTEEQFQAFARRLSADPVLQELAQRWDERDGRGLSGRPR